MNAEQAHEDYFKQFFDDGGKYMQFVSLTNAGAIAPGDHLKVGKEYKIGLIVSVNVDALRKQLETDGIIKNWEANWATPRNRPSWWCQATVGAISMAI